MSIPVLLAITGAPWEADVVRRTERAPGIRVVRRCVDIADVMAAAASGQARAVLLADDLPRLSSDAVAGGAARGRPPLPPGGAAEERAPLRGAGPLRPAGGERGPPA